MSWRPDACLAVLRARARMLERLRDFFAARGVLEVETPIASRAAATDPQIESVEARIGGRGMFLHTSPEFAMKRLLAAGSGDIYQVCRVFRDGEQGRLHNPEFTMLEWYRIGFDHLRLMDEVESLLRELLGSARIGPVVRTSFRDACRKLLGLDPFTARSDELVAALQAGGVARPPGIGEDREALLDLALGSVVGPQLGARGLCFVFDYPAERAALARIRAGDPPVAERFEVYLDGIELANGFHELADADEQRRRFASELAQRARRKLRRVPADDRLLAALAAGLPDCAGVALGLDRVLMIAVGARELREVLSFSFDEA